MATEKEEYILLSQESTMRLAALLPSNILLLVLAIAFFHPTGVVDGFVVKTTNPPPATAGAVRSHPHATLAFRPTAATGSTTRLYAGDGGNSKKAAVNDGSTRGLYLMGIVLLACVWVFSIPTEFRRAHICTSDLCVENRQRCYDCVTTDEWIDGVKEYYRNGGGIQFDFSVAQSTKDFWAGGR